MITDVRDGKNFSLASMTSSGRIVLMHSLRGSHNHFLHPALNDSLYSAIFFLHAAIVHGEEHDLGMPGGKMVQVGEGLPGCGVVAGDARPDEGMHCRRPPVVVAHPGGIAN